MAAYKIILGNKNYSSWSLRPWLVLRQLGLDFEEEVISLYDANTRGTIRAKSPSGKLPVLVHGDVKVWESLAICEYLAEQFPDRGLWPSDPAARAFARSVSHEMHAGFGALRGAMPMNLRKKLPLPSEASSGVLGPGPGPALGGVATDIARVQEIWKQCRERFGGGGDFLCGSFGVVDAMYAPVATRFRTYGVPLSETSQRYVDAIFALPALREWIAAAEHESWVLHAFEK